ncbi:MAG: adenylate cyclase [Bowdeniella nasicola]|nr:adenylate cyclase [Bowdeniella nasicola]
MDHESFGDFEFERRFFVRDLPGDITSRQRPSVLIQSYLLASDGYAVRVRAQASEPSVIPTPDAGADEALAAVAKDVDFCVLTAKGPYVGGTRYEAERELDVAVGLEMVRRGGAKVAKLRYSAWLGTDGWVIDQFLGANAPLIIAECERGGPVTDLVIPAFCTCELTEDARFSNDHLAIAPYRSWAYAFEEELATSGPRFVESFGRNRHAER